MCARENAFLKVSLRGILPDIPCEPFPSSSTRERKISTRKNQSQHATSHWGRLESQKREPSMLPLQARFILSRCANLFHRVMASLRLNQRRGQESFDSGGAARSM